MSYKLETLINNKWVIVETNMPREKALHWKNWIEEMGLMTVITEE